MADSKTGKKAALAAQAPTTKVVIGDAVAERDRLIRLQIASGIYPSSENAKALLRVADAESLRLTAEVERLDNLATTLEAARDAAEAEVKRLRDELAEAYCELENIKTGFTERADNSEKVLEAALNVPGEGLEVGGAGLGDNPNA